VQRPRKVVRLLVGVLAIVGVLFGADARGSEPDGPEQYDEVIKVDGILVADGRAMQLFTGSPNGARHYARVVNEFADRLRGKVDIYSVIVPTAQTFYLPESYVGKVREEPPNINATYKMLDSSVATVDVVGSLQGHESENLYFRTDHHWTGLAAYYAYAEFCKTAGFKPTSLDPTNKRTISPYRGSLYRYAKSTKEHKADVLEYWLPNVSVSVERYSSDSSKPSTGSLLKESSKGYGVFLGGDYPLMIARSSSKSGRRALLIKNSYGNPFAVYLVEQYETVVIVDYRKFDGSVPDLIDEHGITDLIFINGAITANAKSHVGQLEDLLDGSKPSSGPSSAAAASDELEQPASDE
jgi:hypothetical protein